MTKIPPAAARNITKEWAALFPQFDMWKPWCLLRRIGPVVQGITLDVGVSREYYYPTAHVHALTREFPVISLTFGQRLLAFGQPKRIFVFKQQDLAADADTLREQCRLSLDDPPTFEQVIETYHRFAESEQKGGFPLAVRELEDFVLLSSVAGRDDLAEEGLRLANDISAGWTDPPVGWDDTDGWLADLAQSAADKPRLQSTVDSEIAKHKLTNVRVS